MVGYTSVDMPIYEYRCNSCKNKVDLLRSLSNSDSEVTCLRCQAPMQRLFSTFACFSKDSDGSVASVSGGGDSCSNCHATSCSTCH